MKEESTRKPIFFDSPTIPYDNAFLVFVASTINAKEKDVILQWAKRSHVI